MWPTYRMCGVGEYGTSGLHIGCVVLGSSGTSGLHIGCVVLGSTVRLAYI